MDSISPANEKLSIGSDCRDSGQNSPKVPSDGPLQDRVRELFLSRNSNYPPVTPFPSPKFSPLARNEMANLSRSESNRSNVDQRLNRAVMLKRPGTIPERNKSMRSRSRAGTPKSSRTYKSGTDPGFMAAIQALEQRILDGKLSTGEIVTGDFDSRSVHSKSNQSSRSRVPLYAVHTVRTEAPEIIRNVENHQEPTIAVVEDATPTSATPASEHAGPHKEDPTNAFDLEAHSIEPSIHHGSCASAEVAPLVIRKRRGLSTSSYDNPPSPHTGALQTQGIKHRNTSSPPSTRSPNVKPVADVSSIKYESTHSVDVNPEDRSHSPNSFVSARETPLHSKQTDQLVAENCIAMHVRHQKSEPSLLMLEESSQQESRETKILSQEPTESRVSVQSSKSLENNTSSVFTQETTAAPRDSLSFRQSSTPSIDAVDHEKQTEFLGFLQTGLLASEASPNPSTKVLRSGTSSAMATCDEIPNVRLTDSTPLQQIRSPSLPTNFGSTIQRDLVDLLQKASRARTMSFGPSHNQDESAQASRGYSLDFQHASAWISEFLRSKLSREQLRDQNLTARPLRKSKSYFDQYSLVKSSEELETPYSNHGDKSKTSSGEVGQLDENILASLNSNRLETIIKELETVIEDALERATNAREEYDPELYKELQEIAASLRSPTETNIHDTKTAVSGREEGHADTSGSHTNNARPIARMKRIVKNEQNDPDEVRTRLQEYHRTLLKVHDRKMNVYVLGDRAESYQRAEAPKEKESAVPSFLQDSCIDDASDARGRKVSSPQKLDLERATTTWSGQKPMPLFAKVGLKEPIPEQIPILSAPRGLLRDERDDRASRRDYHNPLGEHLEIAPPTKFSSQPIPSPVSTHDWAMSTEPELHKNFGASVQILTPPERPAPSVPEATQSTDQEKQGILHRRPRKELKKYMKEHDQPPVQARKSSMRRRSVDAQLHIKSIPVSELPVPDEIESDDEDYVAEFGNSYAPGLLNVDGAGSKDGHGYSTARSSYVATSLSDKDVQEHRDSKAYEVELDDLPRLSSRKGTKLAENDLSRHRHLSFRGRNGFSLHKSHRRSPIARDWSNKRKRFVASIACVSTALLGIIIGVYAGEAPALQYALVDEHHRFIYLGNVLLYLGLAISNFLFWPLPLLHGRKPYTLSAFVIILPLIFPQAVAVMQQRDPSYILPRVGLLLPRFLAGLALGFANMNFFGTLLDVFGASLMSGNPHQEVVNPHDARRHGGGMGVWLSIWTWCYIGSIGLGFFIGALIIGYLNVSWGFWITIFSTVVCILLNVIAPETRRSAYRRSMTEVQSGTEVSRRIARGEVMMHLYSTGPKYWWQEMLAGWVLCLRMLRQVGFVIFAVYQAWIYGQVVMVMILLGALISKYYYLLPHAVALSVAAFPLGALLAVPFQKASIFSRARHHPQRSDSMTFEKKVVWTSHMARRTVFMAMLPLIGLAYTLSSGGVRTPIALPITFAAFIGFLSNLALSECQGIMMENFDTSDLQPGMTGRPRSANNVSDDDKNRRTNFSCFPRVTAAFAIIQSMSFIVAAAATACGGNVERSLGAQAATACVAGILLILTLLLVAALVRFKSVQVVPNMRVPTAILSGPGEDLPVIIGHPSGTTRRICLLELGAMTRWTEIRKKNKLL